MSGGKLWRNSSGKLIASDGKLVLSDSCPCIPVYDLYGTFNLRHEFYWGTDEPTIPDDIPASTIPGGFNIEIGGITTPPQYSIVSVETITSSSSMVTYGSGQSGLYPADWSFYYWFRAIPKSNLTHYGGNYYYFDSTLSVHLRIRWTDTSWRPDTAAVSLFSGRGPSPMPFLWSDSHATVHLMGGSSVHF